MEEELLNINHLFSAVVSPHSLTEVSAMRRQNHELYPAPEIQALDKHEQGKCTQYAVLFPILVPFIICGSFIFTI
jgi:hypothetical protein